MQLHVHLLKSPDPDCLKHLKDQTDSKIHITTGDPDGDYHILVGGRPERSQLESSPELSALIIPFSGIPESTRDLLQQFPEIEVHNLHHNAIPTAEMAVALLFSAAKYILPFDRSLRKNDWRPRYQNNPSILLHQKRVLILGYGSIGQHVGKICQTLGMDVLAIRKSPSGFTPHPDTPRIFSPEALHDLLPTINVLIITLPLTSDTRGMIGMREIELMPPGSILVNVARGAIVDEAALYRSLQGGHLAGAGLDVWYNYPEDPADRPDTPPANFPFQELNNVVMSPHRGGSTRDTETLRMDHLAVLLNAAARGERIPNKVNIEAGY